MSRKGPGSRRGLSCAASCAGACCAFMLACLEHDPEKWCSGFRIRSRSNEEPRPWSDSIELDQGLGVLADFSRNARTNTRLMTRSHNQAHSQQAGPCRRTVLQRLLGVATLAAGIDTAWADDRALDALLGDVSHGEFGQGFDQASRTVHIPKATVPRLSQ